MPKNLIVKDNALINASYNLDLVEQRIILLAVAQSRKKGIALSADRRVNINIVDYINIYNINGRSVYENIKNACATLFERQFTYMEKQENGVRIAKSRWVSEVAYNDKASTIDVTFAPAVIPLINMLEKHFTSYELEKVADLNSKYSVRLYEILIAWRSQGQTPMLSLDEIRYRLGVAENEYKLIEPFKRRVLDLSVKEISEKTDIQVSYEQHKQGRKIIGFTFSFDVKGGKKESNQNNKAAEVLAAAIVGQEKQCEINPIFQSIAAYVPIADQQAYLERYSAEQVAAIIERANEYSDELKQKKKKVNFGAIFRKAFAENWGGEKFLIQQAEKQRKEAARREAIARAEQEKADEQQRQAERKELAMVEAIFEAMSEEKQNEILDQIEAQISGIILSLFQADRKAGKPVHKKGGIGVYLKKIILGKS